MSFNFNATADDDDILVAIDAFDEENSADPEDAAFAVHCPMATATSCSPRAPSPPPSAPNDGLDVDDDEIVSVAWCRGSLAVAHFRLVTAELAVADETYDLQPDYPQLHNLFRRTRMRHLIAAGPPPFLQRVAQLSGLPPLSATDPSCDLSGHRMSRPQLVGSQFLHIYSNEEKWVAINRRRLLAIRLPDMHGLMTDCERQGFVANCLPMHQPMVVMATGNLLAFLDANWRYVYLLPADASVELSDLRTYRQLDAVLMDESTALALQIFSPTEQHPSALKKGSAPGNRQSTSSSSSIGGNGGASLYAALARHCASICGARELRSLMLQPTQDVGELAQRHATIEWAIAQLKAPAGAAVVAELRERLRTCANPSEIYQRLQQRRNRPADWRLLQRAAVNIYKISVLCAEQLGAEGSDVLRQLGSGQEQRVLRHMLCAIYKVMDIAMSLQHGTFVVRAGFDEQLDDMRDQMLQIRRHLLELCQTEVATFPAYVGQCVCLYFEHFGFLLGVSVPDGQHADFLATVARSLGAPFRLMHQDASCMYFQTAKSKLFNDNYGSLYLEIVRRERHIGQRLLGFVYQSVQAAQRMARLCARLDCLLAMAQLAVECGLNRPQVLAAAATDDEHPAEGLSIRQGRHIMLVLQQQQTAAAANDTRLGGRARIAVLNASNSAGKSVYLKQVGLIAYMAHIGSFVPATEARIPLLDGIYSRIYALECTHQGGSAFLHDLRQMSKALCESSARSLILIDEFGKGTNAVEGEAILQACVEALLERGAAAPLTMVATHCRDVAEAAGRAVAGQWTIRQQSFEMRRDADGGLRSTYRLIDGRGPAEYARQCGEVAQELHEIEAARRRPAPSMAALNAGKLEVALCIVKAYLAAGPAGLSESDVRQIRDTLFPKKD